MCLMKTVWRKYSMNMKMFAEEYQRVVEHQDLCQGFSRSSPSHNCPGPEFFSQINVCSSKTELLWNKLRYLKCAELIGWNVNEWRAEPWLDVMQMSVERSLMCCSQPCPHDWKLGPETHRENERAQPCRAEEWANQGAPWHLSCTTFSWAAAFFFLFLPRRLCGLVPLQRVA